ncbi:hypothetical protein JW916_09740 [Candidatus Sumerlaeota bacterium]|nr:hypothetical protein [Candidatus Sumerlaeota bacterium]
MTSVPRKAIDVAVFTNEGLLGSSIGEMLRTDPPLEVQVQLGQGVSIAPILPPVADYVLNLCLPHGLSPAPVRQFDALYAFTRDADPEDSGLTWDPGKHLLNAIVLSRLAHPTSIGFGYSARLFLRADGEDIEESIPGPIHGFGAHAFVSNPENYRNWLTREDALLTRRLADAFYEFKDTRPERVNRALWIHEDAARTELLNRRWVLIVSGLESLINVNDGRVGAQFCGRTARLAERFGISWSPEDAQRAWKLRSKLAHGQSITDSQAMEIGLYSRMEEVLRVALRESLLNPDFGSVFADDARIREELSP